jgi:hypothetical protein
MEPTTAIAKVLTTYAGQMFTEITAKGDQRKVELATQDFVDRVAGHKS